MAINLGKLLKNQQATRVISNQELVHFFFGMPIEQEGQKRVIPGVFDRLDDQTIRVANHDEMLNLHNIAFAAMCRLLKITPEDYDRECGNISENIKYLERLQELSDIRLKKAEEDRAQATAEAVKAAAEAHAEDEPKGTSETPQAGTP